MDRREREYHKSELALEIALETRKFEIELFWRRSGLFWLVIAAAFVAYGALYKKADPVPSLIIGCFGFACSIVWTLVNRGSKYWQENWEQKIERLELEVVGRPLFGKQEKVEAMEPWLQRLRWLLRQRWLLRLWRLRWLWWVRWLLRLRLRYWLRAQTFSPSRLAIALSDVTALTWFLLIVRAVLGTSCPLAANVCEQPERRFLWLLALCAVVLATLVGFAAYSPKKSRSGM